jgi:simple sugar transport system substrate-binding protein
LRIRQTTVVSSMALRVSGGVAATAAAVGVAALVAFGSSGAAASAATSRVTAHAASAIKIIGIGESVSDSYESAIVKGAEAAAKAEGVTYQYISPSSTANLIPALSQSIATAVSEHPAGIAFEDSQPSAFQAPLEKAMKAGVKVALYQQAPTTWLANGYTAFVGQDAVDAGKAAAEQEIAAGVKHGVCVNHAFGIAILDNQCDGFKSVMLAHHDTYGQLNIPIADFTDATYVVQATVGFLRSHPNTDGMFTLNSSVAQNVLTGIQQSPRAGKVKLGTTDMSTQVLQDIRTGKMLFCIDQQPYLQGYYTVLALVQSIKYGIAPVGQVLTGPDVINKSNVAAVIRINQLEPGVRGAQ